MKPGDTVRFLNDIGGGLVARIEDRIAYVVDPDGFETPMPINECVVVPSSTKSQANQPAEPTPKVISAPKPTQSPLPTTSPAPTPANNVMLLFEPQDIRRLSQTAFDLYLVNDTAANVLYSIAARDRLDSLWTPIAAGNCLPGVQDFLGQLFHTELNLFENIAVQLIVFNPEKPFELQAPVALEVRFDVTRLAKLHCFSPTVYSEVPVLTLPILSAGRVCHPTRLESLIDNAHIPPEPTSRRKPLSKPAAKHTNEPEVVDLHISELIDSPAGLEPAEMLAYQLEVFDKKMAQAAKKPGTKIIFIHGKGEGVLRRAILDRLRHRWPRCEAQDASFREYGFGATQVTIHK